MYNFLNKQRKIKQRNGRLWIFCSFEIVIFKLLSAPENVRNLTVDPNTTSANVSFTRPIGFVLEYLVQVAPNDSVHDVIFNERLNASDFDTDANAAISVLVPGLSPNTSYMVNVSAFSHHNQSEIMSTLFNTGKYERQTCNKNCAG